MSRIEMRRKYTQNQWGFFVYQEINQRIQMLIFVKYAVESIYLQTVSFTLHNWLLFFFLFNIHVQMQGFEWKSFNCIFTTILVDFYLMHIASSICLYSHKHMYVIILESIDIFHSAVLMLAWLNETGHIYIYVNKQSILKNKFQRCSTAYSTEGADITGAGELVWVVLSLFLQHNSVLLPFEISNI